MGRGELREVCVAVADVSGKGLAEGKGQATSPTAFDVCWRPRYARIPRTGSFATLSYDRFAVYSHVLSLLSWRESLAQLLNVDVIVLTHCHKRHMPYSFT